ncbi:MAG: hypothetical protein E7421_03420 [Ruminococcaceae bacterium]|nr:hypothetical protein [Oscillospiraceae bacterium]
MLGNFKSKRILPWCLAAALFLSVTTVVGDTQCRDLQPASIDKVYIPEQEQSQQPVQNKDYLQAGGQAVWLAPWNIQERQSAQYTFRLEAPAAQTVTATGTAYVQASAALDGQTVTLNLSLTDAGKILLTAQKAEIQVACGNTSATFFLWLLPQGVEVPQDADKMPVDVNQICKRQTQGVYLKNGKAYLLLNSTNRNTYMLTFKNQDLALQGLRYSLDKGETYTQLHDWNKIYLPLQETETTLLVLDYSLCDITAQSELEILLERQNDDTHKQQTVSLTVVDSDPWENLPTSALLTPEQPWRLSAQWNGCDYTWKVYQLTNNDGSLTYEQVEMPNGFTDKVIAEGLEVSLQGTENMPAAGTYQLLLQWQFEGIACGEASVPFFINYPLV